MTPPEIEHWVKETPEVGTTFELHGEGAQEVGPKINFGRGSPSLPLIKVGEGTCLKVPTDFWVRPRDGHPKEINLETLDRCGKVVVSVSEDLFKAAFKPNGEPLSPLEKEKTG